VSIEGAAAVSVRPAVPALAGLLLGLLFLAAHIVALHDPRPHGVPVGVEGGAPAELWQARLDGAGRGLYEVRTVPSADEAVRQREVFAAIVGVEPVVTFAGANGSVVSRDVRRLFLGYAPNDLVPFQSGDRNGASLGPLVLGTLLGGFLTGALLASLAVSLRTRLITLGVFAVVFGGLAAVVVGPWVGALTGHFVLVWTWVSATALTVALVVSVAARIIGWVGIAVAALLFLILGDAAAGTAFPLEYSPALFRVAGPWLPPHALASGLWGTSYFDASVWRDAFVLAVWAGAAGGALVALERVRGGE
jgi:hypothetical protein